MKIFRRGRDICDSERPFGRSGRAIDTAKQYGPRRRVVASLILSDDCLILQTPLVAVGENARARVS
jgi:hypothetical protein